jgi:DNA-binding Lrp family transcriptional regulator
MLKQNSISNNYFIPDIDKIDIDIIKLLIKGDSNKEISAKLNVPLSTIQRRSKKIMDKKLVIFTRFVNPVKFGYHIGLLHVYVSNGNINETAKKVLDLDGITSVEIHIGNSDILADFAYKDSMDLLDVIVKIKKLESIEKVIWSERIAKLDEKDEYQFLNN